MHVLQRVQPRVHLQRCLVSAAPVRAPCVRYPTSTTGTVHFLLSWRDNAFRGGDDSRTCVGAGSRSRCLARGGARVRALARMAGVALSVATLVACALLLVLVHLELQASSPRVVHHEPDASPSPSPPPPPRPHFIEPLCQVRFGRAECMRGGVPYPCPEKVDQVRHDTTTTTSGAWLLAPTYTYFLDLGLSAELARLFAGASVVELGAGKGCYAAALRRAPRQRRGASRIAVRAFDGAPNVAQLTGGLVQTADLTRPLRAPPGEWVLCLETAEHIPRDHEDQLIANLHALNTVGVVLSWSNNAGGNGHVNLRTNEWVVQRLARLGYVHDEKAERALRRAVTDIHWFRDTVMVVRPAAPMTPMARGARFSRLTRHATTIPLPPWHQPVCQGSGAVLARSPSARLLRTPHRCFASHPCVSRRRRCAPSFAAVSRTWRACVLTAACSCALLGLRSSAGAVARAPCRWWHEAAPSLAARYTRFGTTYSCSTTAHDSGTARER